METSWGKTTMENILNTTVVTGVESVLINAQSSNKSKNVQSGRVESV